MASRTEPRLPIWDHAERLLRSVENNTVTLTVAGTGVGKSTQIPQMLLQHFEGQRGEVRILCSQPRRLAAVAIAERVAFERGGTVGAEIGYAVGQRRKTTASTRVTFLTAGLLLRRLKAEGERVFDGVSALVVDEVHERSVESDATVTCVRRLMKHSPQLRRTLKIVLVSATLDVTRYKDYWRLDDSDHVNVVTLDVIDAPTSSSTTFRHVDERYLSPRFDRFFDREAREWGGQLRISSDFLDHIDAVTRALAADEDAAIAKHSLSDDFHNLIAAVVRQCYLDARAQRSEDDEASTRTTLVFLPTYRCLEKQYATLRKMMDFFEDDARIEILHSSIDLDDSVKALSSASSSRRPTMTIILATNVAESSVTIPDVVDVVDSCLTNQIVFHHERRASSSRVVFASRSQLTQRKGRAGRVRDGRVWRLVPADVVEYRFDVYETPALKLCCLDDVVLTLAASKSRVLRQVDKVLDDTLDPPENSHVHLAVDYLEGIDALQKLPATRNNPLNIRPTNYGNLLAEMPVSVEIARFAASVAFATRDLRGAALLAACRAAVPKPILRPFGSYSKAAAALERYSEVASQAAMTQRRRPEDAVKDAFDDLLAHYSAYEFWQGVFLDNRRRHQASSSSSNNAPTDESAFAARHDLVLSALSDVESVAGSVFACFHRHRLFVLNLPDLPKPAYLRMRDHVCVVEERRRGAANRREQEEDHVDRVCVTKHANGGLVSRLFTDRATRDKVFDAFQNACFPAATNIAAAGTGANDSEAYDDSEEEDPRPPCRFFLLGQCR